jgi:hypothetical protein
VPCSADSASRLEPLPTGLPVEHFVFIDETWVTTNMTRLHGRATQGQRVVDAVPHGH